jgi:F0F1-type ATP synthase assembly protein I
MNNLQSAGVNTETEEREKSDKRKTKENNMGKRIRLIFLSVILLMIIAVLGNLVDTKMISPNWSILVIILFLTFLGIGFYGFITYTVPVYKKIFIRVKSVIFRTTNVKEEPLMYRGKYRIRKNK